MPRQNVKVDHGGKGELYLKGQRDYVQGPTLFDYIVAEQFTTENLPEQIDFFIHRLVKNQCILLPADRKPEDSKQIVGEFHCSAMKLQVVETDELITVRRPYDEELLQKQCVIEGNSISVPKGLDSYSPMEKIVGAYKYLLITMFQDSYGKFIFARIQLDHIPQNSMVIRHERIISKRYMQAMIMEEQLPIGTIFFGIHKS